MFRLPVLAALLAELFVLLAGNTPTKASIDSALAGLSELTGFTIHHSVEFESLTRKQVNEFLSKRIRETMKSSELHLEELTLKKFGFVPQDFDLRKTTIDLLTEQTAAFYDFHRKKLYITDWAASALEQEALVHELAHALADQNYSLEKFAKKVEEDSEQSLARQAVVEGQASWLMARVLVQLAKAGTPPPKPEKEEESNFPVFDRVPLYLQESLTFPYSAGEKFQQAVYARVGKEAFAYVFRHPPLSSQQVIHPELYFAGLLPVQPQLPEIKGTRKLVEGPVGELDHQILLQQYCGEAVSREISPHWRGGKIRILEQKKDQRTLMVYRSAWNDPESAAQYFSAYQQVLAKKWKALDVLRQEDHLFSGRGDDGYFQVALNGAEVTSMEGFEKPF